MNITINDLQALKRRCSEPIDKDTLIDIREVQIDQSLPKAEKIMKFITLINNPYLYKYGEKVIRINFASTEVTFEDRIKGYFEML